MPQPWISSAIKSVNWNGIAESTVAQDEVVAQLEKNLEVLQYWIQELINNNEGNRALPFLYEAHSSMNDFCSSISLGLYKLSASSIRTILEAFLNFSYYKDHPVELTTLINNNSFYLGKSEIIDYHSLHSPGFSQRSSELNTLDFLNTLYKEVSQIIHGQIPGKWNNCSTLNDTKFDDDMLKITTETFARLVKIINLFHISYLSDNEWGNMNIRSRSLFLKGIPRSKKLKISRT